MKLSTSDPEIIHCILGSKALNFISSITQTQTILDASFHFDFLETQLPGGFP